MEVFDELDRYVFFPESGEGLVIRGEGSIEVEAVGLYDVFGAEPAVERGYDADVLIGAFFFFGRKRGVLLSAIKGMVGVLLLF